MWYACCFTNLHSTTIITRALIRRQSVNSYFRNMSITVPTRRLRVSIRLCIGLDGKSWAVLASAAEAELREWELDKTKG